MTVDLNGQKAADMDMHWSLLGRRRKCRYEPTLLTLKKRTTGPASFKFLQQQERFDAVRGV